VPRIWTALICHHRSIFWPIDRGFRRRVVIAGRPELTALLTAFPRAAMLLLIVGIAQAEAFVLHVAPPPPAQRHTGRSTPHPRLTTRRFAQRRVGIATEATLRAGNRLGFHAVGWPGRSLVVGIGLSGLALARQVPLGADRSLLSDHVPLHPAPPPPWPVAMGAGERA
jgi:hypothetical protein